MDFIIRNFEAEITKKKSVNYADCLIIPMFYEDNLSAYIPSLSKKIPNINQSLALEDFKTGKNSLCLIYTDKDKPFPRFLLASLGKKAEFKAETLKNAVATAVQYAQGLNVKSLALCAESLDNLPCTLPAALEEVVLGAELALYTYDKYLSKKPEVSPPEIFYLLEHNFNEQDKNAVAKAEAIAQGMYFTRDLINGPANEITPAYIENTAKELAEKYKFKFSSFDKTKLIEKGFGALLAIAQGSTSEPHFIILEHAPKGTEHQDPIILVGKGVTFDSGGLSLKPSAGMHEMKTDMSGAATVIGLLLSIGKTLTSFSKQRIIALIPCAENMPDGNAIRPGDVITTLAKKTVEITNTDAEGRLLLCDALTYAQNTWKPKVIIDIATLTGACVVALGEKTVGLFSNQNALANQLFTLGETSSERFWHLPIWDEDLDGLKSESADLNNAGPREGGANFAALFLKQFVDNEVTWAHLDIAGPARCKKKTPTCIPGGSAITLRTLYNYILQN